MVFSVGDIIFQHTLIPCDLQLIFGRHPVEFRKCHELVFESGVQKAANFKPYALDILVFSLPKKGDAFKCIYAGNKKRPAQCEDLLI